MSRTAWAEAHDIRFLELLFLLSADNDAVIITKTPITSFLFLQQTRRHRRIPDQSLVRLLRCLVRVEFLRIKKWSLLVYLVYAAYEITNALVNLTCFGQAVSAILSSSPSSSLHAVLSGDGGSFDPDKPTSNSRRLRFDSRVEPVVPVSIISFHHIRRSSYYGR